MPTAVHLGAEDLPFVDIGGGNLLTVIQVREQEGSGSSRIYGVNLNLAADGIISSVSDGAGTLALYYPLCEAQGLDRPDVVVA